MSHPKFSLRQQASVRDHIDAVKLVQFLQDHALEGSEKEIAGSRIKAAIALLKKCLPDLQSTTLTNDEESGPLRVVIEGIQAKHGSSGAVP